MFQMLLMSLRLRAEWTNSNFMLPRESPKLRACDIALDHSVERRELHGRPKTEWNPERRRRTLLADAEVISLGQHRGGAATRVS